MWRYRSVTIVIKFLKEQQPENISKELSQARKEYCLDFGSKLLSLHEKSDEKNWKIHWMW